MAAHAVTGIAQVHDLYYGSGPDAVLVEPRPALELSCWTEQLTPDVWRGTYRAVQSEDALTALTVLEDALPALIEEWSTLGCPETLEEWQRKKYEEV